MSFENLMQDAKQLEKKAADTEYQQMVRMSSSGGAPGGAPPAIDYDEIKQKYEGKLGQYFEPFTHIPDPKSHDGPIKNLSDAMEELSHGQMSDPINDRVFTANQKLSHITSAGDKLEDWTGEAADGFKTKFLDPFNDVSTNQFLALAVMKGALEAHQEMCIKARRDIVKVVDDTRDGLDNVNSCGKNEWSFAFAVATAVAAIGAIPLTGGASAGIAAVGAAGAVGSAGVAGEEVTSKASGGSAEQVVESMKKAINKLTEETRKAEQKVAKALIGMGNEVHKDQRAFVSAKPKLAGMDGKELTGDSGLGRAT